jgi:hypothetical protein
MIPGRGFPTLAFIRLALEPSDVRRVALQSGFHGRFWGTQFLTFGPAFSR